MRFHLSLFLFLFCAQAGAADNTKRTEIVLSAFEGKKCLLAEQATSPTKLLLLQRAMNFSAMDNGDFCTFQIKYDDLRNPLNFCALSGVYVETYLNTIPPDSHGCKLKFDDDKKALTFSIRVDNFNSRSNTGRVSTASMECRYVCLVDKPQSQIKDTTKH